MPTVSSIGLGDDRARMVHAKQYRLGLLLVHGMGEQERGDTITQMGDALTEWLRRWITPPVACCFVSGCPWRGCG